MLPENYVIDRIKELCGKKHISRYRLAQKSGIAQSSISTLLNRKSVPTIHTLDKLCDGFDITLAQFFTEDGIRPDLTEEQRDLLDLWDDMSEEEKALVKAYIRGLKRQ